MPLLMLSNPPATKRRRKSKRRASAKQRANWARFAAMARKKAKKSKRRRRSSSRRRHTTAPAAPRVRRRRRRASRRTVIMARRSSRRRPRRSSHKRRYRRNPGGGLGRLLGGGRKLFGVVDTGQLTQAAVAVGGFTLTAWLLAKLDKSNKLTGWNRILAKAGVAIAAGYALHMARAPRSVSAGIALGGLVSAGLDVYNKVKPGGMAGLGWYGVDAQDSQMYPSDGLTLGDMDELPEGTMVMDPSGATFVVAG